MSVSFSTLLRACDPARNHWRAYRVEVGQDLLGDGLVEVTFGRVGPGERSERYVADDGAGALRLPGGSGSLIASSAGLIRRVGRALGFVDGVEFNS